MTDRLSTLLHDEATHLDIPPAPVDRVLAGGRTIRRRRRTRVAVAVAALAVLVAAGVTALAPRADRTPEPVKRSDVLAYQELGAWISGDEVHIGRHTATVDLRGRGFDQLRYTSVGVVADVADGYVLVDPAGHVRPLDLDLLPRTGDLATIATDTVSPRLAYVRDLGGGRAQPVVRDLGTGEETIAGPSFRADGPTGADLLSGDVLRYSRPAGDRDVDWRTGDPLPLAPGFWQANGVALNTAGDGVWELTTFDGDPLLTVTSPDPASDWASLSPDGRYFAITSAEPGITVHDIATGTSVVIPGRSMSRYGWTPDGHLVGKRTAHRGEVEVCDPTTGDCDGTGLDAGDITLVAGEPGSVS